MVNKVASAQPDAANGKAVAPAAEPGSKPAAKPAPAANLAAIARETIGFAGSAAFFGLLVQKGRIYSPTLIQSQMLLTDFSLLEFFLSGVVSGQITFALLEHLDPADARRAMAAYRADRGNRGLWAVLLGSSIMGSGFALSGACPGTLPGQLATGVPGAATVLAGSLAGIGAFTLLEPWLKKNLCNRAVVKERGVYEWLDAPYGKVALVSSVALAGVAAAVHFLFPHSAGYGGALSLRDVLTGGFWNALKAKSWQPYTAGALVGVAQALALLLARQPLGTSSSLVALLSPVARVLGDLGLVSRDTEVYGMGFPSRKSLMLSLYVFSLMAGAWAGARLGGTEGIAAGMGGAGVALAGASAAEVAVSRAVPLVLPQLGAWLQSFIGGFALFFGARLAKGCTSGHGMSGFALLQPVSFVAVPGMFGGGILVAQIMKLFA